jgi:hypothetical protein
MHHAPQDYPSVVYEDDGSHSKVVVFHMTDRAKLSNAKRLKKQRKSWFGRRSSKKDGAETPENPQVDVVAGASTDSSAKKNRSWLSYMKKPDMSDTEERSIVE